MKKQDTFPGFGDIPDEPDGFGDILQRQLYDLILTTLHAFRLHADTPEHRKASPLSLELRLPARVFDLQDTPPPPADSPDFLHHGNELLLRLFYSYDVNEITADVSGYDPELADRIRRQAQDLVQERFSELTPEQREKLMKGATERGMDAANRLLADAMKKADTLQGDLDTQRRTIIFIADSTEEPPYPCSLEGFRQAIRDLTYPPAEQFIHPAAMAYQAMQKEDVGKVTLSFDFTDREGADRRRILKGSLSVHFFPLFLDISAAFVDPDAFPQGPELTDEQAADVERQMKEAQESQDFFRNLLTIAQAFFPVVVSLDTGGVPLATLPKKERAAFWDELLEAAHTHFFPEDRPEPDQAEPSSSVTPDTITAAPHKGIQEALALACVYSGVESLSDQLEFDDFLHSVRSNLQSVASSLTLPEFDLLHAISNLRQTQGGTDEIVIHSMQELAEACALPAYNTARGRHEHSGRDLMTLYHTFLALARKVFRFSFVYDGEAVRYTAPFYRIAEHFGGPEGPLSDQDEQALLSGQDTPELLGKLRNARIILNDVYTFGTSKAPHSYLYRPASLLADIRQMQGTRARRSIGFGRFIRFIILEHEWLRVRTFAGAPETWDTRPRSFKDLAARCGMEGLLRKSDSGRIIRTLKSYAKKAMNPPGYITAANFKNPDRITFTINHDYLAACRPTRRPAEIPATTEPPGPDRTPAARKPTPQKQAQTKPTRPLTPEEQTDAEDLFTQCADIFRAELPAKLAEIGVTVKNPALRDEDIQAILRPYIARYTSDTYGFEPQLTERFLLGGLRLLCQAIVTRKESALKKADRRHGSTINSLRGYLLSPQRKTEANPRGRSLIEREVIALSDKIHEQTGNYRRKHLEGKGPEGINAHKAMIRKVKALALSIGAKWPERD